MVWLSNQGDYYSEQVDVPLNANKNQIVEITIPLKTIILRSEESQDDFYKAVDKTIDKLERQLRKNKTRLSKHNKSNK